LVASKAIELHPVVLVIYGIQTVIVAQIFREENHSHGGGVAVSHVNELGTSTAEGIAGQDNTTVASSAMQGSASR